VPAVIAKLPPEEMQQQYREHVLEELADDIPELAHQELGCWCKSEDVCHAKVLREFVANYLAQQKTPSPASEFQLIVDREPLYKASKRMTKRAIPPTAFKAPVTPAVEAKESVAPQNDTAFSSSDNHLLEQYRDVLTPEGKVPLQALITKPVVRKEYCDRPPFKPEGWKGEITELPEPLEYTSALGIHVIVEPLWPPKPPPFISELYTHSVHGLSPTRGFVNMLKAGGTKVTRTIFGQTLQCKEWNPFVAQVVKIIRNKTTKRFMLMLSEKPADKVNSANSAKVHLASQMFGAIENRFVRKDDLVYVAKYAITRVAPRKQVVLVTSLKKVF
jgi:hypothetical protein